ncbi:extracellular solute-binding protein [Rudaeicoccus suwonensis]|uniref:Iron(III) transport system substrate-binding protein n=1 Tax=Rudaeicoccus suwonensis TaxID=657409 RepID=A0A561E383_9MICO|nr:extracellular solute-binding protein [Rudaeicoccus suwonensis]TWE10074.1 iron(III) transport system substrate-binding protein [Rudaeicoccus suwonensis]
MNDFLSRPSRRSVLTAAGAALVAGTAAACGSGSSSSHGSASETITLYNAQHPQTTDAMISAFTAQTGIKVRVVNDDEDVLTAQLEQEGSNSPADVFYTENSNWLQQLADRKMLATVDAATRAGIPKADSAIDGSWVGISARISALIYNPAKIGAADLPTTIAAMADRTYKGRLEIAPSETDFWPLVCSVARATGNAATLTWLNGLKTNAGAGDNVPDNETLSSDVNQGTTDFAVINHYYFYRLRAELGQNAMNAKLAYFAPGDPGFVRAISGAAILKSSKHQAAAQKFLAFMTAEAGQTVLAHGQSYEYPLRAGVSANVQLPPLSSYKTNSFDPADLGTGETAKTLLQQSGLM